MATGTLWRGTAAMIPGKEKWSYTATKVSVVVMWNGPYADCHSTKPAFGVVLSGYPGMYVSKADVTELDGDAGQLEITLEAQIDASGLSFAPLGVPTFELEFAEISRPLEMHSRCGFLNPLRGPNPYTGKIVTWDDWSVIQDNEYDHGGSGTGIGAGVAQWDLPTFKALRERGEDDFVLYSPIVRRTTIHLYPPPDVGEASGKIQFPPSSGFSGIGLYDWLAGPDRATRSGRTFTRTTEWLGGDYWDRNVYVTA